MVVERLLRNQTITIGLAENASVTERFAAEELAKFLQRIVNRKAKIMSLRRNFIPDFVVGRAAAETFASSEDLDFIGEDAKEKEVFVAVERDGTVVLAGNRGRTTLYSVYHLLEKLGVRWVYPGNRGTYLPMLETLDLTSLEEHEEADFAFRSLAFDISFFLRTENEEAQRRWVKEILDEVDWATKNKMNSLLLLSQPRFDDYRNNPLETFWQKYKTEIIQAIKKRDLILEYGGHILPALIPTSLFESDKQLFRMKAGKRTKTGNFCVSYPKTLEILKRNASDFFKRHKEAKVFRVWPEDVLAGSWCSCPRCSKLSVYEQSYRATSTLSEALAEVDPEKYVDFLSYHDTVEPEGDIVPHKNILLTYAPRERCYLHSINDPSCERNKDYDRWLLANYRVFRDNVYIFEYYADTILYWSLFVPLSETISKDLEYLKGIGVNKASILLFGAHSFWLHGLNLYIFAKKTWDTTISTDVLKKHFASTLFPSASQLFLKFLEKAERAIPPMLDFTCENVSKKNVQTMWQKTKEAKVKLFECEKIVRDMEVKAESTEERQFAEALRSAVQYTQTLLSSGVSQLFPIVVPLIEGEAKGLTDEQIKDLMQVIQSAKKGLTEGNRILQDVYKEFLGVWGEMARPSTNGFMLRLMNRLTEMLAEGKDLKFIRENLY